MKYSLIALTLLLAGCVAGTPDAQSVVKNIPEGVQRVGPMVVYDFKLADGTRCAAMDGSYSGGITCNWRNEDGR